jgi:hypothetical protein
MAVMEECLSVQELVPEYMSVQECMRIVKEVQGGVFESGICLGDAQSIDKVKGKDLFGWRVC